MGNPQEFNASLNVGPTPPYPTAPLIANDEYLQNQQPPPYAPPMYPNMQPPAPYGPQMPMYPNMQPHGPQIMSNQPIVVTQQIHNPVFGNKSLRMRCPHCQADIHTKVTSSAGFITYILCIFIFIFGGTFGCCLIPFCCDTCKDFEHSCPNCSQKLGSKNFI